MRGVSLKNKVMDKVDRIWMIGGAIAIACVSFLPLTVNIMRPFVPMPLYMVIVAWVISYGVLIVMPGVYLMEFKLLSDKKSFGKIILFASLIFAALNFYYFLGSWEYGIKYQGESHTIIVAAENVVGFVSLIVLAYLGVIKNSKVLQYSANLFLFLLLSWCAFPYLGELP